MGDHFQTVADVEATADDAAGLASAALDRLVGRGIVVAETSDCVLGGAGHALGPAYAAAVAEPDPNLRVLQTNGLDVVSERTAFHSVGAERVVCPHCSGRIDLADEAWEEVSASPGVWCSGGADAHPCPACGRAAGLNDRAWSPPWAFGHLGFTFWNWPLLDDGFVAELTGFLGHRTVRPRG
ncbi:hypothetical protein WEH80_16100 [Actinomycetes bacterium KLBMP 9759]